MVKGVGSMLRQEHKGQHPSLTILHHCPHPSFIISLCPLTPLFQLSFSLFTPPDSPPPSPLTSSFLLFPSCLSLPPPSAPPVLISYLSLHSVQSHPLFPPPQSVIPCHLASLPCSLDNRSLSPHLTSPRIPRIQSHFFSLLPPFYLHFVLPFLQFPP